jgi:PAS domain S-box-containing protein
LSNDLDSLRFRELFEAAPDAIIEVDGDGRIVLLNRVTEQLFGYSREELLGQRVETLVPDSFRPQHRQQRVRYHSHPSRRPMGIGMTLEGQRKDGSRFPVEISLSPVKSSEGVRVSAIIRDVTERQVYTAALTAKNQELERANRLKSEFLSGMSHELRTPLHTIIGFTELLEEQTEGTLNEKQLRFVRHIYRDSQHLLALINDVLDLSKIESGRMELQREIFPLAEALEETVSSLRPRAEAKELVLHADCPADAELYADRLRMKQIFYNLLSNAIKFTPAHGKVSVDVSVGPSAIEICVADTGIGIPGSEHESVFDKFYQVGQRQAGGQEGTGLGLAITKHLIEQHGGTIGLESWPGKGSRFTFTIPR